MVTIANISACMNDSELNAESLQANGIFSCDLHSKNATSFIYFGYGSNMLSARIHLQNPTAERIGIGELKVSISKSCYGRFL